MSGTFAIGGDLEVRRLGFGAMRLCGPGIRGWPEDRGNALRVLRRAVELGASLVDTADSYGPEVNELQVAEALHPYPEGLVVATKGGLVRDDRPGGWPPDGRPEHLRRACEGSLRRLRLERIDLYQLHTVDPKVPLEVSVGTLADMQREGKVRHLGLSNVTVKQLEQARKIVPIVSVQNRYSVADRSSEKVLAYCERHGIAFIPWYPLGDGSALRLARVRKLAVKLAATPAQVALAWLLKKSPVMLPIPGTSKIAHLEENAAAAKLALSDEDFSSLSA